MGRPDAAATMITLRDVTLRRGAKVVLERTNLTVHAGEKAGLVGRNGAGKSSLFALLANRLHADKGDIGSELFHKLWRRGLHLITSIRRNMRNYLIPLANTSGRQGHAAQTLRHRDRARYPEIRNGA